METKNPTDKLEQDNLIPQDTTTATEAELINVTETAITAEPDLAPNTIETTMEISESNHAHEEIASEMDAEVINQSIALENAVEDEESTSASEESPKMVDAEISATSTAEQEVFIEEEHDEDDFETEHEMDEDNVDYSGLPLEQLVLTLCELVKVDEITSVKNRVANVKSQYIKKIKQLKQDHFEQFIASGGEEANYESLKFNYEANYLQALNIYKEKRGIYLQKLENQKENNLKQKEELLESLRLMINSDENLNKIYNEFKELQNKWREIGQVPQNQINNLWSNYHFLVEKFFEKVQINKELMLIGLNKNLEEKIQLCEKTEELLLEKSINKTFKLLQKYHEKWKEIGPIPQEKNDEIWDRFKNATDKVNKRRHDYYEELNEEQKSNLLLKSALCERIESINQQTHETIKDWNKSTDEVNALFLEWKTLGPAPKKHNDQIWKRFKTAINGFYNIKKEYLNSVKDEQLNNYHLKLDLIAQAEAIKDSTEWKEASNEMINLQKKWKEIGSVPKKHSDKIWKTFRTACDHFFNSKEKFFKNIGSVEHDNKEAKLKLIEAIESYVFGENMEENLKTIKDFQRQWIEIGRVPIKDKSKLQESFSKAINKHLSALKITSFDFQNSALKGKLDTMDDKKEGEKMIMREINTLRSKIDDLQKDVNLWDNNLSFFSNSKNADLLKIDFEKKINNAKKEIDVLKAKIRQFDKMLRELKQV